MINIQMIGTDHSLAPVNIREIFSFRKTIGAEAMEKVKEYPGVLGCIILSTCNRMEIWVHAEPGVKVPLYEMLCQWKNRDPEEYRDMFVRREGEEAIHHLFYLTSGLKSAILCEDQILTQVKTALKDAREAYCTDSVLETLFRMAITGSKKVKTGMQTSMANVSAIEQAVREMKARGYSFQGKKCLVIGNGEMGKRSATALMKEGADVTVTVRQYRSGVVDIPAGCHRIDYGRRYELLPECDVLVSATNSPNATITAENVKALHIDRDQMYIDLAVPRDIEAAVADLPHITLRDIDSFHIEMSEEMEERIRKAKEILDAEIDEFKVWYECRDLIPKVQQIGDAQAEEAWWRMGKTLKKLNLAEENEKMLHDAATTASGKVIAKMLFTIRDEAGVDVFRRCLEALEG